LELKGTVQTFLEIVNCFWQLVEDSKINKYPTLKNDP